MKLSRRTLLRGAGVGLGLPWLEAMMPSTARAQAAAPRSPVRMAVLYMPNGVNTAHWYPEGVGRDFKLSTTLEPLGGLNDQIMVLSNLWNAAAKGGDGHYCKESAILTCATIKKTPGVDLANGTSMDQLAAQRLGEHTPLPSLELGIAPVAVGVDLAVGYTRIYGSYISWSNANTPLAREVNPRGVYERLYRAGTAQNGDAAKLDTLLLDRVLGDAKRLRAEVGAADSARLDEYLSTVRSIEQRVQRASSGTKRDWKPRAQLKPEAAPPEQPGSHEEHSRLMLDMIATAFQSDTTRISTFMFGNAVSNVSFRFLDGVSLGHHDTSHHGKAEDKLRQYQLVNRWHVAQYAYLLRKLQAMKEGEATVLDNSMILFGSALSDGDTHSPRKLPLILGGRGGGRIDSGQHLKYTEDTPLANLYVSMLDAFGAPVERFADSTGPLPGVLV
ncbi:MAG: DUF1552 domain-containing protein [Candidatus Solibacter sp.]